MDTNGLVASKDASIVELSNSEPEASSYHDVEAERRALQASLLCCDKCPYKTTANAFLRRHSRKHVAPLDSCGRLQCPQPDCQSSFQKMDHLDEHLCAAHSIKIDIETLFMETEEQLQSWMKSLEETQCSKYLKKGSNQRKTQTFYCYRSSHLKNKPMGTGKRKSRKPVPIKFNVCTSRFRLERGPTGINVIFYKTHSGHTVEIVPLDRSTLQRRKLADKRLNESIMAAATSSDVTDDVDVRNKTDQPREMPELASQCHIVEISPRSLGFDLDTEHRRKLATEQFNSALQLATDFQSSDALLNCMKKVAEFMERFRKNEPESTTTTALCFTTAEVSDKSIHYQLHFIPYK